MPLRWPEQGLHLSPFPQSPIPSLSISLPPFQEGPWPMGGLFLSSTGLGVPAELSPWGSKFPLSSCPEESPWPCVVCSDGNCWRHRTRIWCPGVSGLPRAWRGQRPKDSGLCCVPVWEAWQLEHMSGEKGEAESDRKLQLSVKIPWKLTPCSKYSPRPDLLL